MTVTKGAFPSQGRHTLPVGVDGAIFSHETCWTGHSPSSPSPLMEGKVA
jgi:hypothetical protein